MRLTRRHLLAASALVAAGAATGVGAVAWRWWDQPADTPYVALSPDEIAILDALADACFPPGGTPPMGGAEAGVARYFDGVLAGLEPTQRKLLKVGLHALDAAPLATHGGYLTELPVVDASAAVAGMLASSRHEIRGLAQSLSLFVGMAWFAHPDVRAIVGPGFACGYADLGGLPGRLGAG